MVLKIILVLAVLIAGLLTYVAVQKSDFRISRELVVKASPEKLFPYINNSKKMNDWMPWSESDPEMKMSYSGPEEGVGAKSTWDSPGQMGKGEAEIFESAPNQLVKTKLTYTRPFEGTQLAEMELIPAADGTLVRWSVSGKNNFVGRFFCLFMNMDKMVGGSFEKGLNKLKSQVEAQ